MSKVNHRRLSGFMIRARSQSRSTPVKQRSQMQIRPIAIRTRTNRVPFVRSIASLGHSIRSLGITGFIPLAAWFLKAASLTPYQFCDEVHNEHMRWC